MNILAWNCQGINNPTTIQHPRGLISLHKPDILFLSETLATERHILGLAQSFQYQNLSTVPKAGRRGGLCLMWRNHINIRVLFQSQSYIHTLVTPPSPKQPWLCTGIYGPPHTDARIDLWEDFPSIFSNITNSTSWTLLGDFNEIMDQSEKKRWQTGHI